MVQKGPNTRFANGIVSALIVVFFLAHGLLGSFAFALPSAHPLLWVVWVGVGFVVLHVALSVVTSYQQLSDREFPPSARKKRHLALKWATGGLLAASIVAHIACMRVPVLVIAAPFLPKLSTVVLSAVLAWHISVGMKSLLKDIGLSKQLMTPLRVLVCMLAAAFCIMSLM
ncbi:MAG: hypothetical protein J6D25_04020 [Eggerthellaceae bacterium]|nr:hypothetical protein [Eggerthellaceae bacterium]